jgi:hypothetical protein
VNFFKRKPSEPSGVEAIKARLREMVAHADRDLDKAREALNQSKEQTPCNVSTLPVSR